MKLLTTFRRLFNQDSTIEVEAEIRKITQDAEQLGHADGLRNWPPTNAQLPSQAEESIRARARRLMHTTNSVFTRELSDALVAVKQALKDHRQACTQLPEALRQAQQAFAKHLSAFEVPLHEAARRAEKAARRRRADEIGAGRLFNGERGKLTLMMAGLFLATVIESFLGAALIHDSHPGGYLGAAGLAFTITALSLIFSFSLGRLTRAMFDRQATGWRIGAGGVLVTGISALLVFHAVVAKVRELSISQSFDAAMQHAVGLVMTNPPTEFSSLLVGLLGVGCGLTSLALGYQRADVNKSEYEAALVQTAESALEMFQRARGDFQNLDPARAEAARVMTEQGTKVAGIHKALAEAVHKFETLHLQLVDLHGQIHCAQTEAELAYRTRNLAIRSDPPPTHWLEQGDDVKTVAVPALPNLDLRCAEDARTALADASYEKQHANALSEISGYAETTARHVEEVLAQYQDAVFHDCQQPAHTPVVRTPAQKLATVAELRRNNLDGTAGA